MSVAISRGNTKMGSIPSVSLPAGLTCRNDCECFHKCYARKIERLRPNVHNSYMNNYALLNNDPETYFSEVENAIALTRLFRWHVSGDIKDRDYLDHMVEIALRNKHCEMLCFTKRYDIVNDFLDSGGIIPQNLHLILSAWRGMKMENPHGLPEAHVRYRDHYTTASAGAKECGGNCTECALHDGGCWHLKHGEQIVFNEH